jgi:hypothetical protein
MDMGCEGPELRMEWHGVVNHLKGKFLHVV